MAKATPTAEAELFDVSKTDKRNDKRVVLDYVFAQRFAPELLTIFEPYAQELDEVLATEGIEEINTAADTVIAKLSKELVARYTDGGPYEGFVLRGNGASFFLPKAERAPKVQKTLVEQAAEASPEQLDALREYLLAQGQTL